MADITVHNLSKKFGSTIAVDNVSLEVKDGEFAVFLGPSGSGKSTLLRCLAGLEAPDQGTISIGGGVMDAVSPRDREISMVFQNYALFPLMNVADNIGFPLRVRGITRDVEKNRVKELADRLGIGNLLEKKPRQLSGGEQQRVAIARALARDTKAILMDEPLSSLDAPLRAELRMELKSLQRDFGRTIVYVTHDQVEAMTLADRIGVMKNGRLLQYDVPLEVYTSPSSSFVAGFVGSPAASLLRLKVQMTGQTISLKAPGVELSLPTGIGERLRGRAGGTVVLALRAEGMTLSEEPGRGLAGVVQLVERLGASAVVVVRAGDFLIKCIAAGSFDAPAGTQVWAEIDFSKASLFDPATDERLA